ncbi:MAG: hypothetical protein L0L50_03835 [Propionibacterium sp.]|nr:hypothetical protein [Propionibacterium sp.]
MSTRDDYAGLSDTVLYDVFYEAGTMVGGALVASWRRAEAAGDQVAAQQFRDEHFSVNHERNAVAARDRQGQIAWILRWEARREELWRAADGDDTRPASH